MRKTQLFLIACVAMAAAAACSRSVSGPEAARPGHSSRALTDTAAPRR